DAGWHPLHRLRRSRRPPGSLSWRGGFRPGLAVRGIRAAGAGGARLRRADGRLRCLLAPGSGGRCRGEGRSHGPRFDCGGAGGGAGRQPAASAPGGAEDHSTPAVLLVADGGPDARRDGGRGELDVMVRVAAVVLNWCGYESTVECVESVLASDGAEPIVLI